MPCANGYAKVAFDYVYGVTVIDSGFVATPPRTSVTLIVKVNGLPAAVPGVPVIASMSLSMAKPAGSAPRGYRPGIRRFFSTGLQGRSITFAHLPNYDGIVTDRHCGTELNARGDGAIGKRCSRRLASGPAARRFDKNISFPST